MSREQDINRLQQTLDRAYQDLERCNDDMMRSKEDKQVDVTAYQEKLLQCLTVIKTLRQQLHAYDHLNEENKSC